MDTTTGVTTSICICIFSVCSCFCFCFCFCVYMSTQEKMKQIQEKTKKEALAIWKECGDGTDKQRRFGYLLDHCGITINGRPSATTSPLLTGTKKQTDPLIGRYVIITTSIEGHVPTTHNPLHFTRFNNREYPHGGQQQIKMRSGFRTKN